MRYPERAKKRLTPIQQESRMWEKRSKRRLPVEVLAHMRWSMRMRMMARPRRPSSAEMWRKPEA